MGTPQQGEPQGSADDRHGSERVKPARRLSRRPILLRELPTQSDAAKSGRKSGPSSRTSDRIERGVAYGADTGRSYRPEEARRFNVFAIFWGLPLAVWQLAFFAAPLLFLCRPQLLERPQLQAHAGPDAGQLDPDLQHRVLLDRLFSLALVRRRRRARRDGACISACLHARLQGFPPHADCWVPAF